MQENNSVYFSPEFLQILRMRMHMSDETWRKVIAADPIGWRALLEGETDLEKEA